MRLSSTSEEQTKTKEARVIALLFTGTRCTLDAAQEDVREPFQGILIHWIDIGQIGHAEEQDLRIDSDRNVFSTSDIDIFLGLFSGLHFRLDERERFARRMIGEIDHEL